MPLLREAVTQGIVIENLECPYDPDSPQLALWCI